MEDLANSYEKEYPQSKMGNYSKNQEPKKVKFLPLRKGNSKMVPLNMLSKVTPKMNFDKPRQVNQEIDRPNQGTGIDIGIGIGISAKYATVDSFTSCAPNSGEVGKNRLARDCAENPTCQEPLKVLSKPCGGHYCPGDSATWSHLSAGGFKSPGRCSGVGACRKVIDPGDIPSTCGMCKPLRGYWYEEV